MDWSIGLPLNLSVQVHFWNSMVMPAVGTAKEPVSGIVLSEPLHLALLYLLAF